MLGAQRVRLATWLLLTLACSSAPPLAIRPTSGFAPAPTALVPASAAPAPSAAPNAVGPAHPSAATLCDVVLNRRFELLEPNPLYLRRPDAVEPGKPKRVS